MYEHFIVWCPSCKVDAYRVEQVSTLGPEVYVNFSVINPITDEAAIQCKNCEVSLERKFDA